MTYEVTIEPLGETIEVEEGQTLLDAIQRAGIYIPYQCGHGLCSTCKIDILEGDVELGDASPFALLDFEREEGKALACTCTPLSDLVIEAEVEEDEDSRQIPIKDFNATVSRLEKLTHDIMGVWLKLDYGEIDFQAGQYVNLHLPGLDSPRAFSIASAPSSTSEIELHIRLVPEGRGTTYIHQELKQGDRLTFTGPMGHFFTRHTANLPCIFIAGGSGLSSPKSMVLELLENGFEKDIYLFHGVRTKDDRYFHEMFEEMTDKYANFHYVVALSEPGEGDGWNGETGFIHEAVNRVMDSNCAGHKAYLCGPPMMVEASIRALMKGRLFEKDIYTEKFVTQGDGENAIARSPLFKRI